MSQTSTGGLIGFGKGMEQVGGIFLKDNLETLRQERLGIAQGKRDEKQFGNKKELQTDANLEKELDRDAKASEGQLNRDSNEKIAGIRAQASKDAAAAKGGGKPTTSWKKYQELKSKFLADNDGKLTKEADIALLNSAYGTDERINTRNNEVIFTGLGGEGTQGVTAEYGRPKDEQGNVTGSRRDREFRNVAPQSDEPKAAAPKYPDGEYKTKDGRTVIIKDGKKYLKK